MNIKLNNILNRIEELTSVSFALLSEDTNFRSQFLKWFNIDRLDEEQIVRNAVNYINENY